MPIISDDNLETIYVKDDISTEIIVHPKPTQNTATSQEVEFSLKEEAIVINAAPIKRIYLLEQALRGKKGTLGKVAKHDLLVLKDAYKGGRGRLIHNSEYEFYKENDLFNEIHVDAAWGGIIAWKRIGLSYVNPNMERDLKILFLFPYFRQYKKFDANRAKNEVEEFNFLTSSTELMQHEMEFEDIISKYPTLRTEITKHYKLFHPESSGIVNFGFTDYIRFQAMNIKAYRDKYSKIPMYRKVS